MCGFLSICSRNQIRKEDIINYVELSKLIKHRGPDDFNKFESDKYVSLFYRLTIRDYSFISSQPIKSDCGRYIISFNGEIYSINNIFGHNIKDYKSDTLAISNLLTKFGIDSLNNIRGMFAILVFDKLKNLIYIYRDPFGIKPLFYTFEDQKLIICSEQAPLLKDKKLTLNKENCIRYLKMGISFDKESTFYNEVKQFPKGKILKYDLNSGLIKEHNSLNTLDRIQLSGRGEYNHEEHRSFLNQTIESHLISDSEIASTISSGVDSTYISLYMQSKLKDKAKTYTLESSHFECELDEELINELKNLSIKKVLVDSSLSLNNIKEVMNITNCPFRTSSWLFINNLFKEISTSSKSKVILVGEGGDELYSGYRRLIYPYLFCLEQEKNNQLFTDSINNFCKSLNINKGLIEEKYFEYNCNLKRSTDYEDSRFWDILNDEIKDYYSERHLLSYSEFKSLGSNTEVFYKQNLRRYFTRSLIPSDLYLLDHLSMRYSLELRVPFIDVELYKYVMNISYKDHFRSGFNKFMLRDASVLTPNLIRWNPVKKQRPNTNSLLVYDLYPDLIKKFILSDNLFFNPKLALETFQKDLKEKNSNSSSFWFRVLSLFLFNEDNLQIK